MPDTLQPGGPALRRAGHAQGIFNGYLPGAATGEFTVLESETFRDFGKLHRLQAAVINPVPQNHDPGWDVDPNDFLYQPVNYQPVNVYLEAETCASKPPSGQYLWRWRIVSYTPAVCIAIQQEANPDAPAESWCGRAARAGRLERLSSLRETLQGGALRHPDGPDADALAGSMRRRDQLCFHCRKRLAETGELPAYWLLGAKVPAER